MSASPRNHLRDVQHGPFTLNQAVGIAHKAQTAGETLEILQTYSEGQVRAYIVESPYGRGMVAIGTVRLQQWLLFNLRFWPTVAQGDSRRWHAGFYNYSTSLYAFGKGKGLDWFVGYSLGAGAGQIAGEALEVPTVCVASPDALYDKQPADSSLVVNVCRRDDKITGLPWKVWGFDKVGPTWWFDPQQPNPGIDHYTPSYAKAANGYEPGVWTRSPAEDAGLLADIAEAVS